MLLKFSSSFKSFSEITLGNSINSENWLFDCLKMTADLCGIFPAELLLIFVTVRWHLVYRTAAAYAKDSSYQKQDGNKNQPLCIFYSIFVNIQCYPVLSAPAIYFPCARSVIPSFQLSNIHDIIPVLPKIKRQGIAVKQGPAFFISVTLPLGQNHHRNPALYIRPRIPPHKIWPGHIVRHRHLVSCIPVQSFPSGKVTLTSLFPAGLLLSKI